MIFLSQFFVLKKCIIKASVTRRENFVTTKADRRNHGFGIRNVKKAAAKYNGSVDISTDDNRFCVSVMLLTASQEKISV